MRTRTRWRKKSPGQTDEQILPQTIDGDLNSKVDSSQKKLCWSQTALSLTVSIKTFSTSQIQLSAS